MRTLHEQTVPAGQGAGVTLNDYSRPDARQFPFISEGGRPPEAAGTGSKMFSGVARAWR